MKRVYKIALPSLVLIAILGAWLYYTPYMAAKAMKQAAEKGDSSALSEYIDFPAVKESLKATINAFIAADLAKSKESSPWDYLGAAIASAALAPMVDALVTPEGLATMMSGSTPELSRKGIKPQKTGSEKDAANIDMGYQGINSFVIKVSDKQQKDQHMQFLFKRDGIASWKLSEIQIPLAAWSTASEPSDKSAEIDYSTFVGKHPNSAFENIQIKQKFKEFIGKDYDEFFEDLSVGDQIELHGEWLLGSGCAPHVCGISESAYVINKVSGQSYACILQNGNYIVCYGVSDMANLPAPLYEWYQARKQEQ